MSNKKAIQNKIDEAIFDFTIGENEKAKIKLSNITEKNPENAAAWHALAEILLSEKNYEKPLITEKKHIHIHLRTYILTQHYLEFGCN